VKLSAIDHALTYVPLSIIPHQLTDRQWPTNQLTGLTDRSVQSTLHINAYDLLLIVINRSTDWIVKLVC